MHATLDAICCTVRESFCSSFLCIKTSAVSITTTTTSYVTSLVTATTGTNTVTVETSTLPTTADAVTVTTCVSNGAAKRHVGTTVKSSTTSGVKSSIPPDCLENLAATATGTLTFTITAADDIILVWAGQTAYLGWTWANALLDVIYPELGAGTGGGGSITGTQGAKKQAASLWFRRDNWRLDVTYYPANTGLGSFLHTKFSVDDDRAVIDRLFFFFMSSEGPLLWTKRKGWSGLVLLDAYDRVVALVNPRGSLSYTGVVSEMLLEELLVTYLAISIQKQRYQDHLDAKSNENAQSG
ncbi:putative GLEYA domain-containing protein [Seiridium cardinale]